MYDRIFAVAVCFQLRVLAHYLLVNLVFLPWPFVFDLVFLPQSFFADLVLSPSLTMHAWPGFALP